MKELKAPLVKLCQTYGVIVVLLLHVSKDGQALGRRIKGVTRTLLHLECPDQRTSPERLRLWVEKSFAKKPSPLGVTMTGTGNAYGNDLPVREEADESDFPGKSKRGRGRPGKAVREAAEWLRTFLAEGPVYASRLLNEAASAGHQKSTVFDAMTLIGVIGEGPKGNRFYRLPQPGEEPGDDVDESEGEHDGERDE